MQITLKKEVEGPIVALAAEQDRTPTNLVNKILADHLAASAAPKHDLLGRPVPKKKGGS